LGIKRTFDMPPAAVDCFRGQAVRTDCAITRLLINLGLMVLVTGCAVRGQLPPLYAPDSRISVAHFGGSPLSGPQPGVVVSDAPQDAISVRVSLSAMRQMPAAVGEVLGPRCRLVAATSGGTPILPSTRLIQGARFLSPAATAKFISRLDSGKLGPAVQMAELPDVLPMSVTAHIQCHDSRPARDPVSGLTQMRAVTIDLYRPSADTLEMALTVDDFGGSEPMRFESETALLEPVPIGTGTRLGVVVPFSFADSPTRALAVIVEASTGVNTPAHRDLLARSVGQARQSVANAAPATGPSERSVALETAARLLSQTGQRRSALMFLADQADAPICLDVILTADDETLGRLCEAIARQGAAIPHDREPLGWLLDRTTLETMTELLAGGKLPPELAAVMVDHTGQAGRNAASMQQVLRGASSHADLQARLVAENLIFLEDSSPAARVRAFDWLGVQGRAPADFDPLAPARQRRQALDKALTAGTAGTASGASK